MLVERQEMSGRVELIARERNGRVARRIDARNHIVAGGRLLVANLFRCHERRGVTHLALGSGARPVTSGDSGLEAGATPEAAASAVLPGDDGRPALRLIALDGGAGGNALRVRVERDGKRARLVVEGAGAEGEGEGAKA